MPRTLPDGIIGQDARTGKLPCATSTTGTTSCYDIPIKIKLRCFGDESFWKVLPQTYPYYKI